jgi:hypothetical protein
VRRLAAASLGALLAYGFPQPSTLAQTTAVRFERVNIAAGLDFTHTNGASAEKYLVETMGSGGAFLDFDNDGWLDVFLVDGGSFADARTDARAGHRLFRNRGNGTFDDVTAESGLRRSAYGMGACAGDVDNDGRTDLYITSAGAAALYRNTAAGFVDVTAAAGAGSASWGTSCGFLDADRDGHLDLFVTNYLDAGRANNRFCGDSNKRLRVYCHPLVYQPQASTLYRGDGKGRFTDVSTRSGIAKFRGNGLGVAIADYDDDGWPDVFVANDAVPNFLFHNESASLKPRAEADRILFSEVALASGVAVARDGKPRAGMGTDFGDYDGDGRLDLVVTNHEFETHSLFHNEGQGLFADATVEAGLSAATRPFVGFGAVFFDYDNDTRLDLAIVNGHVVDNTALVRPGSSHAQRRLLFNNRPLGVAQGAPSRVEGRGGRFVETGSQSGFDVASVGRTVIAGDIDNDGDLDLLVTNNGGAADLLRNDGGSRQNALVLKLIGSTANRDGLGARVRAVVGSAPQVREVKSGTSYLGQSDLRLHFGLGSATRVDRLEIRWPGGRTEPLSAIAANQIVTIREGEGIVDRKPFARGR